MIKTRICFKEKTDFICDSASSVDWRLTSPPAPSTTTTTRRRQRVRQLSPISVWASRRSQNCLGTSLQLHCDCSSTGVPCSSLLIDNGVASTLRHGDYTSELREAPGHPGGCLGFTGPLPFPTHHTKYLQERWVSLDSAHVFTRIPLCLPQGGCPQQHAICIHICSSLSYVNKGAVIPMIIVLIYLD